MVYFIEVDQSWFHLVDNLEHHPPDFEGALALVHLVPNVLDEFFQLVIRHLAVLDELFDQRRNAAMEDFEVFLWILDKRFPHHMVRKSKQGLNHLLVQFVHRFLTKYLIDKILIKLSVIQYATYHRLSRKMKPPKNLKLSQG